MQAAYDHNAIYTDLNGLAQLKANSKSDKNGALKAAAKQFEALFMQMMLKQMREASFGDPIFDSSASDTYRSMFDQQISVNLSQSGALGIADIIERQLGVDEALKGGSEPVALNPFNFQANVTRQAATRPQRVPQAVAPVVPAGEASPGKPVAAAPLQPVKQVEHNNPAEFVNAIWPHAEKAAGELGVPAEAIVSQAALETGWGRFVTQRRDGSSSFNLFNIKADHRWEGERVSVPTTEYRDGVVTREQASFRAYDSYQEAFADYVSFLKGSARYSDALQSRGDADRFLAGLQQAGYATDPQYANKISGIMRGEVLSGARAGLPN